MGRLRRSGACGNLIPISRSVMSNLACDARRQSRRDAVDFAENVALPDSEHAPSQPLEISIVAVVAFYVPLNLPGPVRRVVPGPQSL